MELKELCPLCKSLQLSGTPRCPVCGYNGFENIAMENTQALIVKDLLLEPGTTQSISSTYPKNRILGGEKMVQIERPQETAYLKATYIVENKISELKFTSEPDYVETEFEGTKTDKMQGEVIYNNKKKSDPHLWTLNKTSTIALFDVFGKDTKTWMDKPIPITVTGEGKTAAIMVDKIRLG